MKPLVLLSGGVDSATLLYYYKQKFPCVALNIDYAQANRNEIIAAGAIAEAAKVTLYSIRVDMSSWRSSLISGEGDIVVPFRNMIFISLAAGLAKSIGCDTIGFAAQQCDHSVFPDCRPEFVASAQAVLDASMPSPPKIDARFINTTKAQILFLAKKLGVPLNLTWSCYSEKMEPCGLCLACTERKAAEDIANARPIG